jgi:hypothetical protein
MGLNVSALNQYVDQNKKDILINLVQGANTFAGDFIHIEEGVEAGTKRELKYLTTSLEYQRGSCVEPSGSTSFSIREITSTLFSLRDEWCATDADLKAKFPAAMKAGANGEMTDEVIGLILDNIGQKINRDIAHTIWAGGYSNVNDMDSHVTGWIQRLRTTYSGDVYGIATAGGYTGNTTAPTEATILAQMKALSYDMPEHLTGQKIVLNVSSNIMKMFNAAMFAEKHPMVAVPNSIDTWEFPLDSNIVIKRDDGLANVKAIVATPAAELVYVNDLNSSKEEVVFYHDLRTNMQGYRISFAIGTEIKFSENVGLITWA